MEININDKVTIKLLGRGVEAYNKYYSKLNVEPPKKVTVGSELTIQLWEVMNIFGEYTYMGPEPPFETEIKIHN